MELAALFAYPLVLYWTIPLGAALFAGIAFALWRRHTAMRRRIDATLTAIAHERLHDIVLPDAVGGAIHIDHLLLTSRGLLVLDVFDVRGHVFGAEKMDQWTVMDGFRRHVFPNPLRRLRERVSAVHALAPSIPVKGHLVFTERSSFPKGMPPDTVMLGGLLELYGPAGAEYPRSFHALWEEIKSAAQRA